MKSPVIVPSRARALALAKGANVVLGRYVAIDDAIFAVSFWRGLRRLIPVAGVFEAIPYASHATTLSSLREDLRQQATEVKGLVRDRTVPRVAAFAANLCEYVDALDTAINQLEALCRSLAAKGTDNDALSLRDYRTRLADYRESTTHYVKLGTKLNASLRAVEACSSSP